MRSQNTTHLNTSTLIRGEDLQSRRPGPRSDAIVPHAASEAFITLLQRRLELELLVVLRCRDLDVGEGVREIDRSAEDTVINFNEGSVLVTVEVLKRGTRGFEDEEIGETRGKGGSNGVFALRRVNLWPIFRFNATLNSRLELTTALMTRLSSPSR